MTRRPFRSVAAAAVCLSLSAAVAAPAAALNVGDEVRFAARLHDGTACTNADYDGQLLAIYFWASWHPPAIAQFDTLEAIAEHVGDQGVCFLGVCLDDLAQGDASARETIAAAASGAHWKHTFAQTTMPPLDTRFFGEAYAIPTVWLVSPDGEALWSGHPAELPEQLAGFLESHPPTVVPEASDDTTGDADDADVADIDAPSADPPDVTDELVAEAKRALLDAEDAYTADPPDFGAVLSALASIAPEAAPQPLIAAHGQRWKRMLDAADADTMAGLVAARDADPNAALALDGFLLATAGVDAMAGKDMASPDRVALKLKGAQRHADRDRPLEAYDDFLWVVDHAAGTPDADPALIHVLRFEADPEKMAAVAAAENQRKAEAQLFLAKGYVQNYNEDEAIVELEKLIADYPDTEAALEAKALLDALKQ